MKPSTSEMASVVVRLDVRISGGEMETKDFQLLRRWVELNRDVLIRYGDGDIEFTEDALAALRYI